MPGRLLMKRPGRASCSTQVRWCGWDARMSHSPHGCTPPLSTPPHPSPHTYATSPHLTAPAAGLPGGNNVSISSVGTDLSPAYQQQVGTHLGMLGRCWGDRHHRRVWGGAAALPTSSRWAAPGGWRGGAQAQSQAQAVVPPPWPCPASPTHPTSPLLSRSQPRPRQRQC